MNESIDKISTALLNKHLPDDWRKLAPETTMQLASWLNHLQVISHFPNRNVFIQSAYMHTYTYLFFFLFVHLFPCLFNVALELSSNWSILLFLFIFWNVNNLLLHVFCIYNLRCVKCLQMRAQQYKYWSVSGEPIVMWLSGLHAPNSYLRAIVQVNTFISSLLTYLKCIWFISFKFCTF